MRNASSERQEQARIGKVTPLKSLGDFSMHGVVLHAPAVSARRHRLLGAVVVEAALDLAAEPAGLDVLHQERAGAILAVGQPLIEHLHDREAGVEADEI